MMLRTFFLCLILLSSGLLYANGEFREWKNSSGKSIKASYISSDGKKVTLKREDGKTFSLDISKLSKDDQEHIQELEDKGAGDESKASNSDATEIMPPTFVGGRPVYQKEWGNYDDPWPAEGKSEFANIEITPIKEEGKEFIYESPHFRFISDAPINIKVVKTIAINFEATFDVCSKLPLGLSCRSLLFNKEAPKYVINLYENKSTYLSKGGSPTSAGFYRYPEVHVPFSSMGLKKRGNIYILDGQGDQKTIIHEVVHQMTHGANVAFPHWYSEGIAEYISISSNKNGLINLRTSRSAVMEYVTGFNKKTRKGRMLGNEIELKSMKSFYDITYEEFSRINAQFCYGFSAILFMYYAQVEGKGDGKKLRKFAQALNEHPNNATQPRQRDPKIDYTVLLDGKSWDEYDKEMEMGIKKTKLKFKINPESKRFTSNSDD